MNMICDVIMFLRDCYRKKHSLHDIEAIVMCKLYLARRRLVDIFVYQTRARVELVY